MNNLIELPKNEARKAVILARVSSKEQEEGHSIEAQKHRLQGYCQRRNLDVLRVFEITESSTRGDRTKFMEMIKFCKSQRHSIAIVADKVDRVQRSFKEYPLLDALIQEGKIELHFNTEGYVIHQGSMSQERLMWSFGVIMAQSYTDNLRDNVKRSIDHKIRMGEFPSVAPIGYLNVRTEQGKSDIIIDQFRVALIRKIFAEFATGTYTLSHITEKAKEWGLRNKTKLGNSLHRSHLYLILTNPFYYGIMVLKGQSYPHRYPPLIDKSTFDKCAEVLRSWNKKPFKYGNKEFVFRGLVACKTNNKTVSSITKKKTYLNGESAEWTYLQSWNSKGKQIYIREEKVLQQAETALRALVMAPDVTEALKDYLRITHYSERDFLRRQLDELKKEDSRLQNRLDGLMDLFMDGAITRDEFDRRKVQLRERQIEITNQLTANRDGDDGFKDSMLFILDLCNNVSDLFKGSTIEQKRAMLNAVLCNQTLEDETLCYSYRIPFSGFIEASKTGKWSQLVDRFRTCLKLRQDILSLAYHLKLMIQ